MTWFNEHYAETLLVIGIVILAIEVVVLGFSTFFLFFIGLATVVTAGLMYFGIVPETWLASLMSISVFTAFFALLLWRKLKSLQSKVDNKRADNDIVGHSFVCPKDIDPLLPLHELPTYNYSGISWRLMSEVPIKAGDRVAVKQTDVGILHIIQVA
ncbi:NfeD family protein [Glaciecola sp. SC05]|uniref:NfeD family protein n=1 Tax=Glaciecola sp. SC05 TaxID=1987355 RepID=UPI003527FA2E